MIDDLIEDLKTDEGWREHAYQDHLGYWTIGYGFLVDERKDAGLPLEIGEAWLTYAATTRWNKFVARHPWVLNQHEEVQRALANMCYQMGVAGVSNFKRMLAALKNNDRSLAAREALDSQWAVQTPNRAKRVTDLMRG